MTILANHCLLSWALNKGPNPIVLGEVRKTPYRHMPPNGWRWDHDR